MKETDEDCTSPLDLLFQEVKTGMRYMRTSAARDEAFEAGSRRSYRVASSEFSWVRTGEPVVVDSDFCLLHYKMLKDAAGKTMKSILVSCNTRMDLGLATPIWTES
nr:hypothetical protein [Slackia exigua]